MLLIICAYCADLILGDPEWLPHPVRFIGKLITLCDNKLNNKHDRLRVGRLKGFLTAVVVITSTAGIVALLINLSPPDLKNIVWIYFGYTTLATRDLYDKSIEIYKILKTQAIHEARYKLSQIVGRDTENFSEQEIAKATIECIAESTNDGIIAPFFYLVLGGPVLAMIYKAVNTLDSMIGYKDAKYIHFGWFSAKLDDIFNYIPARITGFLMIAAIYAVGKNYNDAYRIMRRDGQAHLSPNSGISEAVMAGALDIQLGGPAVYKGKLVDKPYIGDTNQEIVPEMIKTALSVCFITSLLFLFIGLVYIWMT